MSQENFKRYEKKYLLEQSQYEQLREAINSKMKEDQYGVHTIGNIYYDTQSYELIRCSLDKPVYKEKFRVRSYGTPGAQDKVFLEIKKKYQGIVYKRRAQIKLQEVEEQLKNTLEESSGAKDLGTNNQIMNEIHWFFKMYHPDPKVYIAYDRLALSGIDEEELRVTFDWNLRWRNYDLNLSLGDYGEMILDKPKVLMEIKIPGTMPLWMAEVLTDLKIYPISFSKYGTCYQKNLADGNINDTTEISEISETSETKNRAHISGGKKLCLAVS